MKKFIYIALLITFLLVPIQHLTAESFADADDIFKLVTPAPNTKVGGTINIEWTAFDDDQTSIPYYIQLLDGATCKTTSYGRINPNSASNSSNSSNNKISWDTHKTISTQSLNDGNYCLQICSAFKNTDAYYSVCNARVITIVNVNKLPTISSTPANLTINESENWQYQIKSSDVDNDKLKYYLVFAPDFLEINPQTGLIKSKENASRISDGINIAEYRVVVGVDDGISGTTMQEFTIRVERGRVANPIDNTPSEPEKPSEPENIPSQISITNPKENAELTGTQNFIEWSIYDPDGVKDITLNYSSDLENWTEIITKSEDSFARYSWDVSSIVDGKYYIQIKVKDNKDEVVAKVSKPFSIKNAPEEIEEKKPLILNVKPENEKVLTESPLNITGDFAAAVGEEIDSETFKLSINNNDISQDCIKNEAGFQCTIKSTLTVGSYSITAEIKDLNGNTGTYESKFEIQEKKTETPTNSTNTSSGNSAVVIILIIVFLLIVLVGLPWVFISYSKRKLKASNQQIQKPGNPSTYAYPQASVTFSEPEIKMPTYGTEPPMQTSNNSQTPGPVPMVNQPKSFNDFMDNYSFNSRQSSPAPVQPVAVPPETTKQIGEVKPKKESSSVSDTFKNLSSKINKFIPRQPEPSTNANNESSPVQFNTNPNLSQNIVNAYSGGTSTNIKTNNEPEVFVEPKIVDEAILPTNTPDANLTQPQTAEYVTPQPQENEEELRKMYPELYGQSSQATEQTSVQTEATPTAEDSEYFEPTPKD